MLIINKLDKSYWLCSVGAAVTYQGFAVVLAATSVVLVIILALFIPLSFPLSPPLFTLLSFFLFFSFFFVFFLVVFSSFFSLSDVLCLRFSRCKYNASSVNYLLCCCCFVFVVVVR